MSDTPVWILNYSYVQILTLAHPTFDLVFPCHPDKMVDIYMTRKTQEIQTDARRRSRRRLLLWRPALQFSSCVKCWHRFSLICNIISIWYARPAHTFSLKKKHSQSVDGQGHFSSKINKLLFKSCNSIKMIFIISAHGFVARKYLSFICLWITMRYILICIYRLYVLGRFCVYVVIRYASCVLYSVGSSRA